MTSGKSQKLLTHALEDYLETIQKFVDEKGFARVRDICEARKVKSGSVSPAMKRLSEMGMIHHHQGEFITLTPEGEAFARRTQARHDILIRFFKDFLMVDAKQAEEDSCAIEHHLSDASMDALTRLFEFLQNCPEGKSDYLSRFHECPIINHKVDGCDHRCQNSPGKTSDKGDKSKPLVMMVVGEKGQVRLVDAKGELRSKLLNMGLLPGTDVEMDRIEKGKSIRLLINHHPVTLNIKESEAIWVE